MNSNEQTASGFFAWVMASLPSLIAALAILVLGIWFAGWVSQRIASSIEKNPDIDNTFAATLGSIAKYAIYVMVIVAALGQLGIPTTSLIAALGAAGLAIGLALQGTISNVAASIMLLWLRPFKVGDVIEGGGVAGTVKTLGLFATELHTFDGIYKFVPNNELWNSQITNLSRLENRMVDLAFGVGYDDDISVAQKVLMEMASSDERVLKDPAAITFVSSLDDSCVTLGLRAWVKNEDYWAVRRAFTEKGKVDLEAAGLSIPYPQMDVHTHSGAQTFGA